MFSKKNKNTKQNNALFVLKEIFYLLWFDHEMFQIK